MERVLWLELKDLSGITFTSLKNLIFWNTKWILKSSICNDGFKGRFCDIRIEQISLCDSNPCMNNGKCFIKNDDLLCSCQPKYTGKFCELLIQIKHSYLDYLLGLLKLILELIKNLFKIA